MEKTKRSEFNKDRITQHKILIKNSIQGDSHMQSCVPEGIDKSHLHKNHHLYQYSIQSQGFSQVNSQGMLSDAPTYSNNGEYRAKYPIGQLVHEIQPKPDYKNSMQRTLSAHKIGVVMSPTRKKKKIKQLQRDS